MTLWFIKTYSFLLSLKLNFRDFFLLPTPFLPLSFFLSRPWLGFPRMDPHLPTCSRKRVASEMPPVRGASEHGSGNFLPSPCSALVCRLTDQGHLLLMVFQQLQRCLSSSPHCVCRPACQKAGISGCIISIRCE